VCFDLTDIVIGSGCEMADVSGTHLGSWLGEPTGLPVAWRVVIFFPWIHRRLFRGEKVWSHSDDLATAAILAGVRLDQEVGGRAERQAIQGVGEQTPACDQLHEDRHRGNR
jgi:hypothetical protein